MKHTHTHNHKSGYFTNSHHFDWDRISSIRNVVDIRTFGSLMRKTVLMLIHIFEYQHQHIWLRARKAGHSGVSTSTRPWKLWTELLTVFFLTLNNREKNYTHIGSVCWENDFEKYESVAIVVWIIEGSLYLI